MVVHTVLLLLPWCISVHASDSTQHNYQELSWSVHYTKAPFKTMPSVIVPDSLTHRYGQNGTAALWLGQNRVLLPAQHLLTTPERFDPLLGFSLPLVCTQNVSLGQLAAFAGRLQ